MHIEIKSYLEQTSAIYIGTFMMNVDRINLFKIFNLKFIRFEWTFKPFPSHNGMKTLLL